VSFAAFLGFTKDLSFGVQTQKAKEVLAKDIRDIKRIDKMKIDFLMLNMGP
jgi:hypothetical protein